MDYMPFDPERFRRYAQELSLAIYELSIDSRYREHRKGELEMVDQYPSDWIRNGNKVNAPEIPQNEMNKIEIIPPTQVSQLRTGSVEPIRKNITGATFLASLIRKQQEDIKAQLAKAGQDMQTAMSDLQSVANEATSQVKAVQAETADLKAALGLNSNSEPE